MVFTGPWIAHNLFSIRQPFLNIAVRRPNNVSALSGRYAFRSALHTSAGRGQSWVKTERYHNEHNWLERERQDNIYDKA